MCWDPAPVDDDSSSINDNWRLWLLLARLSHHGLETGLTSLVTVEWIDNFVALDVVLLLWDKDFLRVI